MPPKSPQKQPTQTNRGELQAIRDLVSGKHLQFGPPAKGTPNQFMAGWAAAYGASPNGARGGVLDFLNWQLNTSFWSRAGAEELGTGSHCAIYYGGQDGLVLFALRNGDSGVLAKAVAVEKACMALESLCATPAGHVVMPGARCWVSEPSNPKGGDADQRVIRDKRRAYLLGTLHTLPPNMDTALDWTGLWVLTQLDAAAQKGEAWAKPWPGIKQQIAAAGAESLPPSRNGLTIEHGSQGHRAYFAQCHGMLRPAYWAVITYDDPNSESYGCNPAWPKDEPGGNLPANLPLPKLPGQPKGHPIRLPESA
jgi:hypothetical protein